METGDGKKEDGRDGKKEDGRDGKKEDGRDDKKEDEKERQIKESQFVEEATWDCIILWICPSLQFIEEIKFQVRKCEK